MVTAESLRVLMEALSAPFDPSEVKSKPAVVSGNRALALFYVDARVIMDRLDDVLGVAGWEDDYEWMGESVVCQLRLRLGEEWVTKTDVGSPSEQPDEGDRKKAAFSDALKRTAVKFGVGRYLYRIPQIWVDYDPQKRQFVKPPVPPAPRPRKQVASTAAAKPQLPANGQELLNRLSKHDEQLASQGLCKKGDLLKHVVAAGVAAGFSPDLAAWTEAGIRLAISETKAFESKLRGSTVAQSEAGW